MAETVAVVAAAVQFLDVGGRVLVKLSRLCSDLRRVPKTMKTAQHDLTTFLALTRMIQADLGASRTGPASTLNGVITAGSLDMAAATLGKCICEANELYNILSGIVSERSDSVTKKAWLAVVGVKKKQKIVDGFVRLQSLRSELNVWYSHETLALINRDLQVASNAINLI